MADIVGVDIGTTAVRAVRLSGVEDDGYAVVSRFAIVPIRNEAVFAGAIRNPAVVAAAVNQACSQVGSRRNVVLGAIAPEAAVGRIVLPSSVKERERLASIKVQGIQVAPAIMPHDALLALSEIAASTSADGRATTALNIAATTNAEAEAMLDVASRAKVRLRALDLLSAGTLRALVRDTEQSRDTTSIVDIGASTTRVITREGLHIRTVRTFPMGGHDLTRAIASAAKETLDQAERRKLIMRLQTQTTIDTTQRVSYAGLEDDADQAYLEQMNQQNVIERSLASAAELLVEQIAHAIEIDAANAAGASRHITVCGGSALMRGLKDRLNRRLGVDVRLGHPWAHLAQSKEHAQHFHGGIEDPKLMLELVNAIGLALWGAQ
jgi:type IV pilus assembly protein PilM